MEKSSKILLVIILTVFCLEMVNGGRVALPRGPAGPETTFNVMQFGAKVGKHMHNTQVYIYI